MAKDPAKMIDPKKYILTFKANGVNIFVTDIHKDVYYELEALFIIDKGIFKQYFTEQAYQKALEKGLRFYRSEQKVKEYQKELTDFCNEFKRFFAADIKNEPYIFKPTLQKFFRYTVRLCKDYTKMNIEYTDKAFEYRNEDKVVNHNLKRITLFKDKIRAFMNTALFETSGYANVVFGILAKQFSLPHSVLENLTQNELLGLYENRSINKAKTLKRQKAFVSLWNSIQPIEGAKAKLIINKFEKRVSTATQVHGQPANKGIVCGRVKIVPVDYGNLAKINKEIERMKKGDILVAETTAPELIMACKKAAAIVTDLGGLMSHAAIVSREFKIPCIVGTKIATKVLKDGDTVEVDANNGIIKLIKKYEKTSK